MSFDIAMTGFVALYIFMLAAFAGWVIIGNVPAILHTPLMSGSNFVHGIVVVGGMFALLNASTLQEQAFGFVAVFASALVGVPVRVAALLDPDTPVPGVTAGDISPASVAAVSLPSSVRTCTA